MTYGVIICTKCRKHAQIIEMNSSKTIRCQRCNAILTSKKLRIFYSSEDLNEAVAARTQIQTQLAGKSCNPDQENDDRARDYQVFGEETGMEKIFFNDKTTIPKKRKADEIILETLQSCGGQMPYAQLRDRVTERDISAELFEEFITKMSEAGIIYFPGGNIVRLI